MGRASWTAAPLQARASTLPAANPAAIRPPLAAISTSQVLARNATPPRRRRTIDDKQPGRSETRGVPDPNTPLVTPGSAQGGGHRSTNPRQATDPPLPADADAQVRHV